MEESFFILLDLPRGSSICVDGQPIVLQRDDFVGFSHFPINDNEFHLVTVRAAVSAAEAQKKNGNGTTTSSNTTTTSYSVSVGFVFMGDASTRPATKTLPLVRRYDPRTEEVSAAAASPVEETTATHLLAELHANRVDPRTIISYRQLLGLANNIDNNNYNNNNYTVNDENSKLNSWRHLSCFISSRVLQQRGLQTGDKVVPGAYEPMEITASRPLSSQQQQIDGKVAIYPAIPVIDHQISVRHSTTHLGTKQFLAHLSPLQRTDVFRSDCPADFIFGKVLTLYYDHAWQDLLADVQLSYLLFLHVQCYSSFCHWRDLIAMLSLVSIGTARQFSALYENLLLVLTMQLTSLEQEFLEDSELSEDNFLVPCLKRLLSLVSRIATDSHLEESLDKFRRLLANRFPLYFNEVDDDDDDDDGNGGASDMETDIDLENEDADSDGPVIISNDEIKASLKRSAAVTSGACAAFHPHTMTLSTCSPSIRQEYPILFAAMMPHEDIVMTCARALDEANDVSLVREAAAYLQQVERVQGHLQQS